VCRADNLEILRESASWNPRGLSRDIYNFNLQINNKKKED
jgi:hypothetical protein